MDDRQLEELMVQSFIKIMMETEKTAEGKAEIAQAQVRAEQIKGDNSRENSSMLADEEGYPYADPYTYSQGGQGDHDATTYHLPRGGLAPGYHNLTSDPRDNSDLKQFTVPAPYQTDSGTYHANGLDYLSTPGTYTAETGAYPTNHAPYLSNPYTNDYNSSLSLQNEPQAPQIDTRSGYPYSTVPYSSAASENHQVSSSPNRRRKFGRDHTNHVLPANFDPFKNSSASGKQENDSPTHAGPPGLPITNGLLGDGSENGLKLVVVDKTDDEDDSLDPQQHSYGARGDVFPLDNQAIERDMYKQEYDPTLTSFKPDLNPSIGSRHKPAVIDPGSNPPDSIRLPSSLKSSSQTFSFHVTDYDSEVDIGTQRSDATSASDAYPSPRHFHPSSAMLAIPPPQQTLPLQGHPGNKPAFRAHPPPDSSSKHNGQQQRTYTMSQIDYDRYTNNQSTLSTVMEDTTGLETYRSDDSNDTNPDTFRDEKSKTFVLAHPSAAAHRAGGAKTQGVRVQGPGYKFEVDRYNMVKRASILNRAEQLLDARRSQYSDGGSEPSDEEEDDDSVSHMSKPGHRTLKYVKQFDDNTSINSSDDVLNTMRYQPRGPVSKTARRARLSSVNARLNKQKRIRAARRQVQVMPQKRLPPLPVSDDEDNSSLSDSTEQPRSFQNFLRDKVRYEEFKNRDSSLGRGPQQPLQIRQQNDLYESQPQEEGVGAKKGRRVMFFRNGDIHFKPKQVLINQKTYANFEKLLVDLSSMVETSTGVKHIFSWPDGREIKSIKDFENGKYYICSSTSKLQRVDYGNSKENHWKGGKIDRNEKILFQQDGKVQSPLRRPRVLTIISNMYRDSREKLILNTNSQMNFEDILNDISNMVNIPNPPVRALYTERPPHQKVESYSQLIREFADHDNFLACGEEILPFELMPKKPVSMEASGKPKRSVRRTTKSEASRFSRDQSSSPTRDSEDTTIQELGQDKYSTRFVKSKRNKTDSIRVDINGKIREFFPPTIPMEDEDGRKPDKKLKLDWVYGFRGRDVKQNLTVLPSSGQLVYFVAAVVVLYDKKFITQKHYLGHSEEITCLTIHPNGRFIATGQTAGKTPDKGAHVRVWDGTSLSTYAVIGLGTFQQGISCVNFSERGPQTGGRSDSTYGELLMAIDDSDRHQLTVWDWQTEKLLAKTTTSSDPVVSGCFYPQDETILITYGKEHIHFWKMFLEKGKKIMRDKLSGNFEESVPKFVTSVCFSSSGHVITGDSTGAILIWSHDENNVFTINEELSQHTRKAHKKSVSSLCMLGDGTLLSGGGNEVKAWDSINGYSPVKERILPSTAGHVRSIVPINKGGLDGSIYVSTTRNKVLEGSLQLKFKFIIQGHVEELWAVESHPLEPTFISAGHDQTVVKWSATSHTSVWKVNVENPCTCISIDPRGRIVALGTTAGKIIALNSFNGAILTTLQCGNAQINALGFSTDGRLLGVGTFDGFIQIYHVQDDGHQFFKTHTTSFKHNNIFIMHLDWSMDSRIIQAVLGDYEVVYWDVTSGQKIKSPRLVRDVKWATQNCPIGYPLIGAWQNLERGDVINVAARSQYQDLMIVGDSKGQLRLYKWPAFSLKASYRNTKVFSSNVTCVAFSNEDNFVIASGGNDAALMQFSVLDPVNTR